MSRNRNSLEPCICPVVWTRVLPAPVALKRPGKDRLAISRIRREWVLVYGWVYYFGKCLFIQLINHEVPVKNYQVPKYTECRTLLIFFLVSWTGAKWRPFALPRFPRQRVLVAGVFSNPLADSGYLQTNCLASAATPY